MPDKKQPILLVILKLLAVVLICKIVATVVISYRDYFPPNFDADFLQGRQGYFFDGYQWAFYVHITSGPCSLLMGLILFSDRIRSRFTALHRFVGRMQVACVLLLVCPSGLWMAFYANSGLVAQSGFATLAILTGIGIVIGWRSAVRKEFDRHRSWMGRCYALLCSAIVLRFIGGLTEVFGWNASWIYPASAWACWLLPLVTLEVISAQSAKQAAIGNS